MQSDSDVFSVTMWQRLRCWWAVCGLTLFAMTWRLWVPQTLFPQVPLFGWARTLPGAVEWLCFGSVMVALGVAAIGPHRAVWSRIAWTVFAAACAGSIVADQHRLQPWVWLLLLMSLVFRRSDEDCGSESDEQSAHHAERDGDVAVTLRVTSRMLRNVTSWRTPFDAPSCETLLRWLTISVYFWSAVSKLDRSFFSTHGQTLVEALFGSLGVGAAEWPGAVKWWLAVAMPIGELLVIVGLSWPQTRRAALWGAIGLHVALILALGPFGLGHRPGVLLWNIAFIGHDWLLFRNRAAVTVSQTVTSRRMPTFVAAVILFAVVWPITESFGLCDHWLAWSVYSTRTERVSVLLNEEGILRLPEPIRRLVTAGELPLDRWSIESLDVPIYPQCRFQLGVVEWLRQRCGNDNVLEVIVAFPGSRLKRDVAIERLSGDQLTQRLEGFWVNAHPQVD